MAEHEQVSLRERVREHPSPDYVQHINAPTLEYARHVLFEPQMAIHLAHVVMLERQGIVATDAARTILVALDEMRAAGAAAIEPDPTLEDLYAHVERTLIQKVGADVGGRMHTGRSRNDLWVTQERLALRAHLLDLADRLVGFRRTLLDLAGAHVETVMPGLTHSQHAQVITLGYYLAAFADLVARDLDRLEAAYGRVNRNPLGAAALTTTSFPLDRRLTTALLGFDDLVENGYDAIVSRDDVTESAAAVAILMTHLSRLAEDLWQWSTLEFGYIEFADRYCSVSSIMPQKKNPIILEKLKAFSARAIGEAVAALATVKGVSFSECDDAQAGGNRPLHDAIDLASAALELYGGILTTLHVDRERLRHLAGIGFSTMTDLADAIVRDTGLSFRVAHNVVGRMVATAVDAGLTSAELTPAMLDAASHDLFGHPLGLADETFRRALDPWGNIEARTVTGGPAPAEMARMLAGAAIRQVAAEERQRARRERVAAAEGALASAVREVTGAGGSDVPPGPGA